MKKMYANDFEGEVIVDSLPCLLKFLEKRPAFDSNYFIFTFNDSGFPQLVVFANSNRCVIYYLEEGRSFVSRNNRNECGLTETAIFYENMAGATVELSMRNVMQITEMINVSKDFFMTKCRPTSISWLEL